MSRAARAGDEQRSLHRRGVTVAAVLVAAVLLATLLAIYPTALGSLLSPVFGIALVFFLPGYLGQRILALEPGIVSLTRLPSFFVFSLAIWAVPATILQVVGADWSAFRLVFVLVLWVLMLAALVRGVLGGAGEQSNPPHPSMRIELLLGMLCLAIAVVVARGSRDADDWMYLQITQQLIGSQSFQVLSASEARYSVRYLFHIWIFLQAFLGQWLNVDVVVLLRDWLPALLAPLALLSFFGWAKAFFGTSRAALLALLFQLLIYLTFANADGWGRGFFARSAQDKFLVWLVILPVALSFSWRFLESGGWSNWVAYGAAVIAGLWVHPVSLYLIVLTLGGFALFNLISQVPFAWRRWLWLVVASIPVLASPLVIRATTHPDVFHVSGPEVAAYLRLSADRLLFQPPLLTAHPLLIATPLVMIALALLPFLGGRLLRDVQAQFLWGSALVPLALLFNPITARLLGELLTPWQLWRMTWNIPAAFILTFGALLVVPAWRNRPIWTRRTAVLGGVIGVALVGVLLLSTINPSRSWTTLTQDHSLEPPVLEMMETLKQTLATPATVLLPRDITRYAPAFTWRARVLSNDAQKDEDARGIQIDRFYALPANPKFLDAFLNYWEIGYVVVENGSEQDDYVRGREGSVLISKNSNLTLYRVVSHKPP